MSRRFPLILILGSLQTALVLAQERITVLPGNWNTPSTWSEGIIPRVSNSTRVTIAHDVTIPEGETVFIDNLEVDGRLVVDPGAELHIVNGDGTDLLLNSGGLLDIHGVLTGHDSIDLEGMTTANVNFYTGSVYRHLASNEGNIPVARWDPESTFEIRGLRGNPSMRSSNWSQMFGNLVYDCPEQGAFVSFNGLLRAIAGDLKISNTNSNILKLSGPQKSNLEVAGTILIEGPSEVWFSDAGDCIVTVGGDFHYASASTASSYFTTTGQASVTVNRDFILDAEHRLKMASGTSTGHTNLTLNGNLHILDGKLDALENGSGTLIFEGSQPQHVFAAHNDDTGFEGNISYVVAPSADVDLHGSLISNTTSGDLTVEGTVRIGSGNENGMIQAGSNGNIQVNGAIIFGEGSRIILNGTQAQHIYYTGLDTHVILDNPSGVVLHEDVQFGDLVIRQGQFLGGSHTINLKGSLTAEGQGRIEHEGTLVMNGSEQSVDIRGDTLRGIIVDQEPAGTVRVVSLLRLAGSLTIRSPGSIVMSDGNLLLLSVSESPGATASIGILPEGGAVLGPVTVQRFIQGAPGDQYRYISSPVADATVASLMDDVPVTGIFDDADSGSGLPENTPSLFSYREETAHWDPFPRSGTSTTNYFEPGRGYCFFNWNETTDTNWDVTGEINQGTIIFDITYTPLGNPELDGWNLIGNPYPAAIRWGEAGWLSDSVSAAIAVRDNLSGSFRYWDGQTGSLTGGLIASGQAFWVRAVAADPALRVDENAKAGDGAEYYRRHSPDFLELAVRAGTQCDKAYLRIREGASEGLDNFDAPKFRNDSLSLSFHTSDSVNVAINAVPALSCLSEIPLNIDGLKGKSDLHFTICAEGLMSESTFALIDTAAGRRYDFDKNGSLSITVALNLSALRLLVEADIPVPAAVSAPDVVCPGDSLVVELQRRQKGVSYYLEYKGHRYLALPGSDARSLIFPTDSLPGHPHTYALMGGSACAGPTFIDSVTVLKPVIPPPDARKGFHCGPGAVELSAVVSPGHEVRWYEALSDSAPVGSGGEFTTPVLRKSKSYFATAADKYGCESERAPVMAEISPEVSVTIVRDGEELAVVFEAGLTYQWYFNDSLLQDEQGHRITALGDGLYKVVASRDGCSAVDSFDTIVTGLAEAEGSVVAFPIPCRETLHVKYTYHMPSIRLYTAGGMLIRNAEVHREDDGCLIDLTPVPAGNYILCIMGKNNHVTFRLVKKE